MGNWLTEIEDLHVHFAAYFLGESDSLDRVDAVLADDFSIVGPHGQTTSRAQTMQALIAGHAHTSSLQITITEPTLLIEHDEILVASYVENHLLADRSNHRLSTVIFERDGGAPNGLLWRRVHETWIV